MSSEALERTDGREIQHALNVLHGIQQGSFQRVSVAPALAELAALLAALAVAREREQRAVEALAFYADKANWTQLTSWGGRIHDDESAAIQDGGKRARAALVDEPAAATLAEPDHGTGPGGTAQAASPAVRGAGLPSGSASAAADEPAARRAPPERHPECVECNEDEFYSQPEWAADGVTPCHRVGTAAIKCPVPAVYVRAAADEPGETPA